MEKRREDKGAKGVGAGDEGEGKKREGESSSGTDFVCCRTHDRWRAEPAYVDKRSRRNIYARTRAEKSAAQRAKTGSLQFNLTERFRKSVGICNRFVKRDRRRSRRAHSNATSNAARAFSRRKKFPLPWSRWKNICFMRSTTMRVGCNRRFDLRRNARAGGGAPCAVRRDHFYDLRLCTRAIFEASRAHAREALRELGDIYDYYIPVRRRNTCYASPRIKNGD